MVEALFTLGGAILAACVGVAYYAGASTSAPTWKRLAASAFGPSVTLLFLIAVFWWPEMYRYHPSGIRVLYLAQLLPLALLLYSFRAYPGPRSFHFVLVPLGLVAWAWAFALSFLAVHGE